MLTISSRHWFDEAPKLNIDDCISYILFWFSLPVRISWQSVNIDPSILHLSGDFIIRITKSIEANESEHDDTTGALTQNASLRKRNRATSCLNSKAVYSSKLGDFPPHIVVTFGNDNDDEDVIAKDEGSELGNESGDDGDEHIKPDADVFIYQSRPNKNYGNSAVLRVNAYTESLLKFRLPANKYEVKYATLSLYSLQDSHYGGEIIAFAPTLAAEFAGSHNWREDIVTWNYIKSIESKTRTPLVMGELNQVKADTWYDIDVTAAIKSDQLVTFIIHSNKSEAKYSSKDGPVEFVPKLTIKLHSVSI